MRRATRGAGAPAVRARLAGAAAGMALLVGIPPDAARAADGPTFAVVAYDSTGASWGVACASAHPACGARIPYAAAGMGAVAALGRAGEAAPRAAFLALARGASPTAALDSARAAAEDFESRQLGVVARDGRAAARTGARLPGWAGHRAGHGAVFLGESLEGAETLEAMRAAFEASGGDLGARLLAALRAAGGVAPSETLFEAADGFASAALLVARAGGGPSGESDRLVDLRVDASGDPIGRLASLYTRHAETHLAAARVRFGDEAKRRGDDAGAAREYAAAEAGFRSAVARAPKSPDALNELAWFLALHGDDPAEAVRYAEAAVAARGDDPSVWDTLAEAAQRAGDLERAIEAGERAAKLAKGNARYAERLRALRAAKAARTGGAAGPTR